MAKLYSSSSSWTVINLSALELLLNELKSWLFCVRSMLHDLRRAPSIHWLQNTKQPVIRDLTCSVVSLWRTELRLLKWLWEFTTISQFLPGLGWRTVSIPCTFSCVVFKRNKCVRFLSLRPGVQGGGMQMCIMRLQVKLHWNKSLGNKIPMCLIMQLSYFLARYRQQHNTLRRLNPKKKYPPAHSFTGNDFLFAVTNQLAMVRRVTCCFSTVAIIFHSLGL